MEILVIGGTRFYGVPMVEDLIKKGHRITVATRGNIKCPFGGGVNNVFVNRKDEDSIKQVLGGRHFDVVIDKVAFVPTDIRKLLSNITCDKYILMSSCAVYYRDHEEISENEYVPVGEPEWIDWADSYGEAKRLTECAASYMLGIDRCLFVRYPVVLGKNDYTNRLLFYVEHVIKEQPMYIDNLDHELSYINEDEAGSFISFLADSKLTGAVNGCSNGSISVKQILKRVSMITKKKAIISQTGDCAPFNGTLANRTFSTSRAKNAGFSFSSVYEWIDDLLDYYVGKID